MKHAVAPHIVFLFVAMFFMAHAIAITSPMEDLRPNKTLALASPELLLNPMRQSVLQLASNQTAPNWQNRIKQWPSNKVVARFAHSS